MDFRTLETLRRTHPAWRLLTADHAPLIASFLYRSFIAPNLRTIPEPQLVTQLDGHLHALRADFGENAFPKRPDQYLTEWAADDRGWLRKYYPAGADEAHYDVTTAAERAVDWLLSLQKRQFVGTESRLLTVFALLEEIVEKTQVDPDVRVAELVRRRDAIDAEIQQIRSGRIPVMDPTQVKDRFQQMASTARGLLSDFREVEQNFRALDRTVRERVATWDGSKAELLDEVFGRQDAISDSDQGKSFRAFWDFLMSPERQDQLTRLLQAVFALEAVRELEPDRRLLRIHYDWLTAGEVAQRTVARLSQQLRRYLDDQAWLENRRIMHLIRDFEQHALALRESPPAGALMDVDDTAPDLQFPMDRPLYTPPFKAKLDSRIEAESGEEIPAGALFNAVYVDPLKLEARIRRALQAKDQISLGALIEENPLEQGLAEVVTYLSLAAASPSALIDDEQKQTVLWLDQDGRHRRAAIPLVIFSRRLREAVVSGGGGHGSF